MSASDPPTSMSPIEIPAPCRLLFLPGWLSRRLKASPIHGCLEGNQAANPIYPMRASYTVLRIEHRRPFIRRMSTTSDADERSDRHLQRHQRQGRKMTVLASQSPYARPTPGTSSRPSSQTSVSRTGDASLDASLPDLQAQVEGRLIALTSSMGLAEKAVDPRDDRLIYVGTNKGLRNCRYVATPGSNGAISNAKE